VRPRAFVIILFITASTISPKQLWSQASDITAQQDKPCVFQAEETEVLTSYLRQGTASLRVLVTKTDSQYIDVDALNLQLAAKGRGIPPDVRMDFSDKNKSSCVIQPFTGIPNLRFISKHEENLMFQVPSKGWSKFHKKYGKEAEMLWLSRIGFNSEKTLALLHVSGAMGGMAGGGTLYLFERKDGKWVIKSQIQTWFT
jgi:hypothetical protein